VAQSAVSLVVLQSGVLRAALRSDLHNSTTKIKIFLSRYFSVELNNLLVKSTEQIHGNLTIPQVVEKFLTLYVSRSFITALQKSPQRPFILSHQINHFHTIQGDILKYILILSYIPSDLPHRNAACTYPIHNTFKNIAKFSKFK